MRGWTDDDELEDGLDGGKGDFEEMRGVKRVWDSETFAPERGRRASAVGAGAGAAQADCARVGSAGAAVFFGFDCATEFKGGDWGSEWGGVGREAVRRKGEGKQKGRIWDGGDAQPCPLG